MGITKVAAEAMPPFARQPKQTPPAGGDGTRLHWASRFSGDRSRGKDNPGLYTASLQIRTASAGLGRQMSVRLCMYWLLPGQRASGQLNVVMLHLARD